MLLLAEGRTFSFPSLLFDDKLFLYNLKLQQITSNEIIMEDTDIAKALIDYVSSSSIEILVLGAPTKGGFIRYVIDSSFSTRHAHMHATLILLVRLNACIYDRCI